jgi:hypothetical protein
MPSARTEVALIVVVDLKQGNCRDIDLCGPNARMSPAKA